MCQSLHFRSWSWSSRCLMWRLSPAAKMTPSCSMMPITITAPLWPCFVVPVGCRLRTPREIGCLSCKLVQSRHMSLMVPQITGNSTILVQQRVHNINKNIKVTLYGPCVWEPTGDLWNPPVIGGFPSQLVKRLMNLTRSDTSSLVMIITVWIYLCWIAITAPYPPFMPMLNCFHVIIINCLTPITHQAIAWSNVELSSNSHLGTNFCEILNKTPKIYLKKNIWKCRLLHSVRVFSVWFQIHIGLLCDEEGFPGKLHRGGCEHQPSHFPSHHRSYHHPHNTTDNTSR